jgi:DNA-binding SARP family transcriptional activator
LEFNVLGPLEAWRDGRRIEVRGRKRRALLAILVLHANEVVRRERLLEELWGENPPPTATASLHNQVSRLRKDLGAEVVVTRPSGYVLRTNAEAIDLHRFEQLVSAAKPLPAQARADRLAEALELWRGSPLTDLGEEPALSVEIERLEDIRINALEQRIDADLELGRNGELVPELEALVSEHPLRERLRGQLILALYRAGRQAEALETYRETRRVLIEELGIEPSPELRDLERAILRQDPALAERRTAEPQALASNEPAARRRRAGVLALALLVALLGAAGAGTAVALTRGGDAGESAARLRPETTTSGATVADVPAAGNEADLSRNGTPETEPSRPRRDGKATPPATNNNPTTSQPVESQHRDQPRQLVTRRVVKELLVPSKPAGRPSSNGKTSTSRKRAPIGPFLLADDFSDPGFNSALWDRSSAGPGLSFDEDDRLEMSIAADAQPGGEYHLIAGQYITNCALTGRFDARVSFQTLTWPQNSGVSIVLGAGFPGDYAVVSRVSLDWGEGYLSNFGSWSRVAADDASGTVRLTRNENAVTSYYRRGGRWVKLETRYTPRAAHLVLQLASFPPAQFGGQAVTVAFDHFRATAQYVECPPGVPLPPRVRK